jgi:hypothetical protein
MQIYLFIANDLSLLQTAQNGSETYPALCPKGREYRFLVLEKILSLW